MRGYARAANERWIPLSISSCVKSSTILSPGIRREGIDECRPGIRRWLMMFARTTSIAVICVTRSSKPPSCGNLVWHFFFFFFFARIKSAGTNMSNPRQSLPINSRTHTVGHGFFRSFFLCLFDIRDIFVLLLSAKFFHCVNATIFALNIIYLFNVCHHTIYHLYFYFVTKIYILYNSFLF